MIDMKIAYQIILLFVIVVGLMGAIAEKDDKRTAGQFLALSIAAILSFIISTKFL